jgi:hypothetical protein
VTSSGAEDDEAVRVGWEVAVGAGWNGGSIDFGAGRGGGGFGWDTRPRVADGVATGAGAGAGALDVGVAFNSLTISWSPRFNPSEEIGSSEINVMLLGGNPVLTNPSVVIDEICYG